MKKVVLVYEEDHGLICVAENMRAAYVNLIQNYWIAPDMEFEQNGKMRTLAGMMRNENPTKAEMLEFAMAQDPEYFWEGHFTFDYACAVADQQEVEWQVWTTYADCTEQHVHMFDNMHDAFYFAAKIEAFGDCTDERVVDICCGEHHYHYLGWRPCMEYNYVDACGDVVWSNCYPEYDH